MSAQQLPRRALLASLAAAGILRSETANRYTVGITTNTRGGWEKDVWLSFREAHEAGYHWVESFISYFTDYWDRPEALKAKVDEIGVRFVTISNSAPMEMNFADPARRAKLLEEHVRLARLIKGLGCDHLKINSAPRRPTGTTEEDLKEMAIGYNVLGKRLTDMGLKLAIHPHMWTQFENQHELDRIVETTDPKHVWFVVDTGHITMGGMDPVALTRRLGQRIAEFHLKDVDARYRGGAKERRERNDAMKDPIFFELGGKGGVDFKAVKACLDEMRWRGYLTVELDSSPYRPPKESAIISRRYIENVLNIPI